MLKITTANLNGIRSAQRKGFFDFLAAHNPDIVCVQELKAQEKDLDDTFTAPPGLHGFFHYAQRRGYSGVGIYSRRAPDNVQIGLGLPEFDSEGRFIRADFGALSVISLYLPSGSHSDGRQAVKYAFLDAFFPLLQTLAAQNRPVLVCGDWNIAHQNIDLKNWKGNLKNSGFLPEERAWLDKVLDNGWVDVWRTLYPEIPGYTWWSNRGRAYAEDVGWRIDYQMATPQLAEKAVSAEIYKAQKFSDHAPLTVVYECSI